MAETMLVGCYMKQYFILSCMIIFFIVSINGQNVKQSKKAQVFSIVTNKTYDQVLDNVFPRYVEYSKGILWQFVLRFKPGTKPESQIIIQRQLNGFKVIEYKSRDGSIFNKINSWLNKNGKEDIVAMSKEINIAEKELILPAKDIEDWYETFFKATAEGTQKIKYSSEEFDRTNGAITILPDGCYYEVWFMYRGNEISFVFYDEEIEESKLNGNTLIVKWMNKIRLTIQNKK